MAKKKRLENTHIGWGKLMANFHPNLLSHSWENVNIRKLSLETWCTSKKNQEKVQNHFLSLRATCSPHFKQYYQVVPSQKNPNFQLSQLHSHRWQRRRASEISLAFEISPNQHLLTSKTFMQNVPQFSLSRMIIVAWPAFSASKRILGTRFLCLKPWSRRLAMNVSFCLYFIVNSILLRWWAHCTC